MDHSPIIIVLINFCKLQLPEKGHQDFYPFANSQICSALLNPLKNYSLVILQKKKKNLICMGFISSKELKSKWIILGMVSAHCLPQVQR